MAFSEANRESLYIVEESAWGTTPSPAAMQETRITSESINYDINTVMSDELRADRKVAETVQVSASVGGAINFEMSYGNIDQLLEGAFAGDFSAATSISGDGDAIAFAKYDAGDQDSNYISLTTPITPSDYPVGKVLRISGCVYNSPEIFSPVSLVNAAGTKIYLAKAGQAITHTEGTAATGGTYYIDNDGMLRDGTTKKSYTVEKRNEDITQFFAFTGCRIANMALNVQASQIVTGSVGLMGKAGARSTSTVGTSDVDAPANDVMNATSNVSTIRQDGTSTTDDFESISINIENGLRLQPAVGSLAPSGIGYGRAVVTADQTVYFEDGGLYDKFIAETTISQGFLLKDKDGNAYYVTLPHCEIQSINIAAGGIDTDIMLQMSVAATYDSATDCQIQIDKFDKLA